MKTLRVRLNLLVACVALATLPNAQAQDRPPAQTNPPAATNQANQGEMQMTQHMQEMDTMAKSMTSMADMCRMMMEKEMAVRPLLIAAVILLGTLGTAALAFFVVLEIQWIRYWSRVNAKLKQE